MTRWKRNSRTNVEYESLKEKSSFVTKIYETRSTGTVKEVSKNINLNTLNLRKNIYFKKVQTSLIKVPLKRTGKSLDFKGDRDILYEKTTKHFNENVSKDTTKVFIEEAFNGLLSSQIKMDLLESKCITPTNVLKVSEEGKLEPSVSLTSVENGHKDMEIQTTQAPEPFVENLFIHPLKVQPCQQDLRVEDKIFLSNGSMANDDNRCPDNLNNSNSIGEENLDSCDREINSLNFSHNYVTSEKQNCGGNGIEKTKKKRKRKNKVDILLNACCEFKAPVVEKREVKKPSNYSPVLIKKRTKEKVASPDCYGYTLSGRPKKKPGRQRKYKGAIYHFLDIPQNNSPADDTSATILASEKQTADDISISIPILDSNEQLKKPSECLHLPTNTDDKIHNTGQRNIQKLNSLPEHFSDNNKKLKKPKKVIQKENNLSNSKISTLEYSGNKIVSLLGCRCKENKKEYLVLFENGTSNWINTKETANHFNCILTNFFENSEQDISVMQRTLPSKFIENLFNSNSSTDTDDSSSHYSFSDSDSVFNASDVKTATEHCDYQNTKSQFSLIPNTTYLSKCNDFLLSNDLNELCQYVMSSGHSKLYPFEMTKEIVVKTESVFVHIYLKRFAKKCRINDSYNTLVCQQLIQILEDLAIQESCHAVVVNGIEEYFAVTSIFDRLLKIDDVNENANPDEDISMLRYLIQTIRNFTKPIVAVIRKAVCGLPASLLSLFDMVFDEHFLDNGTSDGSPASCKQQPSSQSYLFPRLTGLTDFNEAKLMGGKDSSVKLQEDFFTKNLCTGNLSTQLKNSLKHMKNNTLLKSTSRTRSHSVNDHSIINGDVTTKRSNLLKRINFKEQSRLRKLKDEIEKEKASVILSLSELESEISLHG